MSNFITDSIVTSHFPATHNNLICLLLIFTDYLTTRQMKIKLKFRRQKIPANPVFSSPQWSVFKFKGKRIEKFLVWLAGKSKENWQPSNHPQKQQQILFHFYSLPFCVILLKDKKKCSQPFFHFLVFYFWLIYFKFSSFAGIKKQLLMIQLTQHFCLIIMSSFPAFKLKLKFKIEKLGRKDWFFLFRFLLVWWI